MKWTGGRIITMPDEGGPGTLEVLGALGIHSTGRFGAWEYNSMEGAMRAGLDLATRLAPSLAGALRPPRLSAGGGR